MYATQQTFQETPDNALTIFTTAAAFIVGTVSVTQIGLTLSNYSYLNNQAIEFATAPDPANGALRWAGWLDDGITADESLTVGFWTIQAFRAQYLISQLPTAALQGMLERADLVLQDVSKADAYASTVATMQARFKRAQGDLTRLYLIEQGLMPAALQSYTENYSGVRSYSKVFGNSSLKTTTLASETEILSKLGDALSNPLALVTPIKRAAAAPQAGAFTARFTQAP